MSLNSWKFFLFSAYLLYHFGRFWFAEKPRDIMEFNRIKDKFQKSMVVKLNNKSTRLTCSFTTASNNELDWRGDDSFGGKGARRGLGWLNGSTQMADEPRAQIMLQQREKWPFMSPSTPTFVISMGKVATRPPADIQPCDVILQPNHKW